MNGLINLEIKILALYNRLCLLEIKGLKDSKKYRNILNDLKKKLNQETEFLKNFDFNSIDFDNLIEKLEAATGIEQSIQTRIALLLTAPVINNMSKEANAPTIEIMDKILEESQTNVAMFIAKYLSDSIKEEQDYNMKKIEIMNFYDLCYIQPRLGTLLLEDSFEVRDEYFKSCYFMAELYNINRNYAVQAIDNYSINLFVGELKRIFYEEKNTNPANRELSWKLLSCNMNALFTILSDEGFAKARKVFEAMSKQQQLTSHPNYEFVASLFEQFKKSQPKVATITFGKPL